MSAEAVAFIAKKWGCSPEDAMRRIAEAMQLRGVIPQGPFDIKQYVGQWFQRKLVVGVTEDGRIALLDRDDRVIVWLDESA